MKIVEQSVEYLYGSGSDLDVVNAARVSFHKTADELKDSDTKLINYLAKHNHWTPFAHTSLSFRIKAPLFVARQMAKHQVGLVWNEVSRRYVDDEPEFYLPQRLRAKAANVKQGSSEDSIKEEKMWLKYWEAHFEECLIIYQYSLNAGVCPEQARMLLPQNTMTDWVWSGTLGAFCDMLKLRLDSHTQYETRVVAEKISDIVKNCFPISHKALLESKDS